jgi:hypothetical protein
MSRRFCFDGEGGRLLTTEGQMPLTAVGAAEHRQAGRPVYLDCVSHGAAGRRPLAPAEVCAIPDDGGIRQAAEGLQHTFINRRPAVSVLVQELRSEPANDAEYRIELGELLASFDLAQHPHRYVLGRHSIQW